MLPCLTKWFGYKIEIQFNKTALVVEQNNYEANIVNAYIVYDLYYWPRNPPNNFVLKDCLFGTTNLVKNSDEIIFVTTMK